jgi:hypothetical protein
MAQSRTFGGSRWLAAGILLLMGAAVGDHLTYGACENKCDIVDFFHTYETSTGQGAHYAFLDVDGEAGGNCRRIWRTPTPDDTYTTTMSQSKNYKQYVGSCNYWCFANGGVRAKSDCVNGDVTGESASLACYTDCTDEPPE